MFAVSHLIMATARLVELILWAYFWIIIARALISWVNPDPYNPIVRFLYRVTEPVLRPIRRRMPAMAGLDLSQHSETAYSLGGSSYGEYGMSGGTGAFAEAMKAAQAKHTAH